MNSGWRSARRSSSRKLEVAVEAANHQDLLEDLRRLRERVELAVMHAAGNEIIARALGRGAGEHGRFYFNEAHFVHDFANFEDNFVAQGEIAMRLGAAEVDVAIAQAGFFGGVDFVFDGEWRCFGVIENVQLGGDELDFAGGEFGVGFLALDYIAFDGDDEFAAGLLGLGVGCGLRFFVEDNLHDAGAVADVEKEQIAEVAAAVHPAHDDGVLAGVGGAQGAAVVGAF